MPSCATCIYHDDPSCTCRRNPPAIGLKASQPEASVWPKIERPSVDWCGHWSDDSTDFGVTRIKGTASSAGLIEIDVIGGGL